MTRQQGTEPVGAMTQDEPRPFHLPHGGKYLRSQEACAFLDFRGKHRLRHLYRYLQQHGIVPVRRGRTLLIRVADLRASVRGLCADDVRAMR